MKKNRILFMILAVPTLLLLYWSISLYILINKDESEPEFVVSLLTGSKSALGESETVVKMPNTKASGLAAYTNKELGFTVDYPAAWGIWRRSAGVGVYIIFGSAESKPGGGFWGIHVRPKEEGNEQQINKIIAETGMQFDDRKEEREGITVGGRPAQKIIVTTPSHPNWVSEKIILRDGGLVFFLGNGAIMSDDFRSFYESFKFLR